MTKTELDEPELEDDYPIFGGYFYLADGEPIRSPYHKITAKELKRRLNIEKLCRCDAVGRGLM